MSPRSAALPDAARAAAWSALWRRLLAPVPDDKLQANVNTDTVSEPVDNGKETP
jgi:hypothetical protein